MNKIEQIQQWVSWAWNHDAAEHSVLEKLDTLLDEIKKLQAESSVLKQQKEEAWTTTGLASEQKRNDLLRDENERLRKAISWALGEGDSDFGDNLPEGAPRYWWRKELRRRAESV